MVEQSLRSSSWFAAPGRNGFIHRSWLRNQGHTNEAFDGRPIIGIANTWSELTPCNGHLGRVAKAVKRGVLMAGGYPYEFPAMSLGEPLMRPTAMLYRNLLAMEAEESIRANPLDGVVLLSGCDKTTPGLLMGALSVNLPAIVVTGGPMLNGKFHGQDIGSGTAVWRLSEDLRAGRISEEDFAEAEVCMSRSAGHCMTMGTASTMACVVEALGMSLPGSAAIPAPDARRLAIAQRAGQRIVAMVKENLTPAKVLTRKAFENAMKVDAAIGGSTNAIIHLLAIAGRVGMKIELKDCDELMSDIPGLVNIQPSGRYLMEDFFYAGGVPQVMLELRERLHLDALTVTGRSVIENIGSSRCWNREVIATIEEPWWPAGSATRVLRGNLAPEGAVIKVSAASPQLLMHKGRAVAFESIEDYNAHCEDSDLDINPEDVIVIKGAGPKGYPGMPEIGNPPIPRKLLSSGVTDMVRISDGRMSGTGFGTCILHVSPESAVGGPLALVETGDMITLDVARRRLDLEVDDGILVARRAAWKPAEAIASRGWVKIYIDHVMSASEGADLDFLVGSSGHSVPRHSH